MVRVQIAGRMLEDDARPIIAEFERLVPSGEFELHLELAGLEQYDPAARALWVESLHSRRARCCRIVLFGARPVIRMVASTIALVLRVPVEFR